MFDRWNVVKLEQEAGLKLIIRSFILQFSYFTGLEKGFSGVLFYYLAAAMKTFAFIPVYLTREHLHKNIIKSVSTMSLPRMNAVSRKQTVSFILDNSILNFPYAITQTVMQNILFR